MPISVTLGQERTRVGWLEQAPLEEYTREFAQRSLELREVSIAQINDIDFLDAYRAVIIAQPTGTTYRWLEERLKSCAKRILAEGNSLIVITRRNSEGAAPRLLTALGLPSWGFLERDASLFEPIQEAGEPPQPFVQLFSENMPPWAIANHAQGFDAGKRPNRNLRIEISKRGEPRRAPAVMSPEHETLLRRAFANCDSVHLLPMDDGHSGAGVYCAHPNFTEGEVGPWTQPYFVKLGPRRTIFREYNKYLETVHPYLPFYLAPRLTSDRCYLGGEEGIIVGDFVDESEGLLDAAEHGRGIPSLAGLFDRTLRAWYRNARSDVLEFGAILHSKLGDPISAARIQRASELGDIISQEEIATVIAALRSAAVVMGPIHGDLHVGNVRVRHGEAVMIDFASQEIGPLLLDVARLEVSFLVDGFRRDTRLLHEPPLVNDWLDSIAPLYAGDPLIIPSNSCSPDDEAHWFYACVEVIRKHARTLEAEPGQYRAALIVALVFKAGKDPDIAEPEASRRAAAYVLASRLVNALRGPAGTLGS